MCLGFAASRLTDVAVWEDGYNADPALAEETFDPGNEWHTYRFELRADELRLLVDGKDVVSGTLGRGSTPRQGTRKPDSGHRVWNSRCARFGSIA